MVSGGRGHDDAGGDARDREELEEATVSMGVGGAVEQSFRHDGERDEERDREQLVGEEPDGVDGFVVGEGFWEVLERLERRESAEEDCAGEQGADAASDR